MRSYNALALLWARRETGGAVLHGFSSVGFFHRHCTIFAHSRGLSLSCLSFAVEKNVKRVAETS